MAENIPTTGTTETPEYTDEQINAARSLVGMPELLESNDEGLINAYQQALAMQEAGVFSTTAILPGPRQVEPDANVYNEIINTTASFFPKGTSDWIPQTVKDIAGAGEVALTFGTGLGSAAVGGWRAIYEMGKALGDKTWYEALQSAAENSERIMGKYTYTPRLQTGQELTAAVTSPFLLYDEATTKAGNAFMDVLGGNTTGYTEQQQQLSQDFRVVTQEIFALQDKGDPVPQSLLDGANSIREKMAAANMFDANIGVDNLNIVAGVGLKTLLDFAPDIANASLSMAAKNAKIKRFNDMAEEFGLDFSNVPAKQIEEWANLVNNVSGGKPRYQALANLQDDLREANKSTYEMGQLLYEEAKDVGGYFNGFNLTLVDSALADIAMKKKWGETVPEIMPYLDEFYNIISDVSEVEGNTVVPINDVFEFRQKINEEYRFTEKSEAPEVKRLNSALGDTRTLLDGFLNRQFEGDIMAYGNDANAIAKWRKADKWWKNYRDNFQGQKVVKNMLGANITAKQAANWILGASNSNLKPQAAEVIKTFHNIFPDVDGQLSPQMQAIQTEVKYGLLEPLILDPDNVDINGFLSRYNTFKMKNSEVINELFVVDGDATAWRNMDLLAKAASAQKRVAGTQVFDRRFMGADTTAETGSIGVNDRLGRFVALNLAPGNTALAKGGFFMGMVQGVYRSVTRGLANVPSADVLPWGRRDNFRRELMSETMGVDLSRPLTQLGNMPFVTATQQSRLAEEEGQTAETLERLRNEMPVRQTLIEQANRIDPNYAQ